MNHIYRIRNTLFWVLMITFFGIYAQELDTINALDHKIISQSLIQGSYDHLKETFEIYKKDKEVATFYGKAYIQKAKIEQDTIQIANGYDLLCKLNFTNYDIAIQYVDSMIAITKNLKDTYYPSRGYLNKGILLKQIKKYKESLQHYLIAQKHARENNNIRHQMAMAHNIGRLKYLLNRQEEAIAIFKENLNFLKSNPPLEKGQDQAITATLIGLSESYNKSKQLDSADFYIRKGIEESFKRGYKHYYKNFLLASGINNTLRKNHLQALDTLYKSEKILLDSKTTVTKSICRAYIAKNLLSLNKKKAAVEYLKKVDVAVTALNYTPDVRDAFELLIDHYKEIGDTKNQLRLLEKLIELDQLTNQKHKDLSIDIVKKYDTELLVRDRDFLAEELSHQKMKYIKRYVILLISVLSISTMFFIWYYKKQKLQTRRILEEKEQIILDTTAKVKTKKDIEIPQELLTDLTNKLKIFENSKRFLDPSISLVSTAKELQTNSTYLSRIINKSEGKNFANYINDLRIVYAIEKLNNDPKYRLYSITAIAEEVGFNNSKSFSRAFLKKTGKQPSFFIKSLEVMV